MGNTEFFDTNNYEFNKGCKRGVYLIHGFTNTTFELLDLAKFLRDNNFYVKLDNLPGHGTSVDDCNKTKYTEYIEHIEHGVAEVASNCDEVHVIGISMGGVLALHLATVFPLASVVEAATVFKFKSEFRVRVLVPLLKRLVPKLEKASQYKEKSIFFGYTHYPTYALNEMRKLTNYVRPNLHKIKCPIYLVHSIIDTTSVMKNFEIIKNSISSSLKNELILENTNHCIFANGPEQPFIFENVLTFLNENSSIK
ncbi:MAG: alpha/beta fold hydrolase [Candidatus Marinimicrobia bacterium]|nr:alpha/beta fold hydrolase [Candidatus Neomarinimicrobiota bacterium]